MMKKKVRGARKKAASQIDLAAPVSQRVAMDNILLLQTVARRKPLQGEPSLHVSINVDVQTNTNKKEGVIQVQPHFVLVAQFDDESGDELLRIEAVFLLQYRMPSFEGLRKQNITAFGEMNGVYNAWPYWREFVQAMTVRMGLPPLMIPVFRPIATQTSGKKNSTNRTLHPKPVKRRRKTSVAR